MALRLLGRLLAELRQVHLQLAVFHAPGILAQLGTARLLGDAEDSRVLPQRVADLPATGHRLLQGRARDAAHVDDDVVLAQLR